VLPAQEFTPEKTLEEGGKELEDCEKGGGGASEGRQTCEKGGTFVRMPPFMIKNT